MFRNKNLTVWPLLLPMFISWSRWKTSWCCVSAYVFFSSNTLTRIKPWNHTVWYRLYLRFYEAISQSYPHILRSVHMIVYYFSSSFSFSFPSAPLPICPAVTWPRIHLFVTVIWSGWLTTCVPTPSKPAVPVVPAHADWQTNALDKSRARNSAALVGQWLGRRISSAFLLSFFFLSQAFQALLFYTTLTFSLSLHWEWPLSMHSSLSSPEEAIIPCKMFHSAYHLLCCFSQSISTQTRSQGERDISLILSLPFI